MTNGNEQSRDVGNLGTSRSTGEIIFTVEGTRELEKAYQTAIDAGQLVFEHEGRQFDTGYARHLIMYLVTEFERRGLWPLSYGAGQ